MRKYKKIVLHTDDTVVFRMENGWNYIVKLGLEKIYPLKCAGTYASQQPYCKTGEPKGKELLKKAKELLQKLPVVPARYKGRIYENEKDFPYNEEEIDN